MAQAITRAPRFKRTATDKALMFTGRDFDLLYALYKYHLATTHQLALIHQGSEQKTRWRLRELFDAGYVQRFNTKTDATVPGSEPVVYALTDLGADWLTEHRADVERLAKRYNLNNARRTLATIPHALMVAEVMLRFELACYYNSDRLTFIDQRELLARAPERTRNRRTPTHWVSSGPAGGDGAKIGNNPDQLFGIVDKERPEGRNTAYFFLEADRGTESVRPRRRHFNKSTAYKKLLGYYHTHRDKLHNTVFGQGMQNFRVLWVIDSNQRDASGKTRLENFLDTANEVTGGTIADLFLFTTYDAFKNENPMTHTWVNTRGEGRRIIIPSQASVTG